MALIYHPEDRDKAQLIADAMIAAGCDASLAPLGLQAGSQAWVAKARADIEEAVACILLLTTKSVSDSWVGVRAEWALAKSLRIIPLADENFATPSYQWKIPKQIALYNQERLSPHRSLDEVAKSVYLAIRHLLPTKCFLSYSRRDQAFADRLQAALLQDGIHVWRDTTNIPGGAVWDAEIERAISRCSCVLFIASQQANMSQNVADELSFARERNKLIVPILLEEVSLPFRVHRAQAVDFRGEFNQAFSKLTQAIRPNNG